MNKMRITELILMFLLIVTFFLSIFLVVIDNRTSKTCEGDTVSVRILND